ncbi:MAG: S-layer homology domain-containing protein, partial [Leptolyngbyaceae cyanobacterium CAN_BIN12]|nr:S-layer homology domain-containing protein [Leptolyngbyaceae cyanobacterium CAN_BIN12]
MSRVIWNSFWLAPALLGATAFSAFAQTSTVQPPASQDSVMNQVSAYSAEGQSAATLGQVTSVSQLTDVRPTDWAFQALQSLIERYGCIVGYPDKTYRGNRALT